MSKLPAASLIKCLYFSHFSLPKSDRVIYRAIRRENICRIVELGVGSGNRAARMIEIAQRYCPQTEISYTGIDLFEARQEGALGISLKQAYQFLKPLGSKIQLVPGDPYNALSQTANRLLQSDLVIISADQDTNSLEKAWYYIPRMLHAKSLVFVENNLDMGGNFRTICLEEIEQLAQLFNPNIKRAA